MAGQQLKRALDIADQRGYFHQEPDAVVLPISGAIRGALLTAVLTADEPTTRARVTDPTAGIKQLRTTGAWADRVGLNNPAVCPWRVDLAIALRTRAPAEAHDLANTAHRQADRFGCPVTQARALCALALIEPEARIDRLRHALHLLDTQPNHLDRALAQNQLGQTLCNAGHIADARKLLIEALAGVAIAGADRLWNGIAADLRQMRATLPPQPRWHRLTALQSRVLRRRYRDHADEATIAHEMALDLDKVKAAITGGAARLNTNSSSEINELLPR